MLKSLLSKDMKEGLQDAVQVELQQSSLWKSLANQMQRLGYFGSQKYFLAESAEELTHYQMHVEFMNDMGDCADLPKIDAVNDKVKTIGDALEIGYEIELDVYILSPVTNDPSLFQSTYNAKAAPRLALVVADQLIDVFAY